LSIYLGIDFGTATLCVTRWKEQSNQVELVPNLDVYGKAGPFPNVIYYQSADEPLIGSPAMKRMLANPQHFVMAIKREMEGNGWRRTIHGVSKSAMDVATDIFSHIGNSIRNMNAGKEIDGIVVSVPFAFQHRERQKIRLAAQRAGLPILALIEEPVAAALACDLFGQNDIRDGENVLVFDFGGGTLDVTVFRKTPDSDGTICIEVITTDGLKRLGGRDIDQRVMDKLIQLMAVDLSSKPIDKQVEDFRIKLRQLAEELKMGLTTEEESEVFFSHEISGIFDEIISRDIFDEWIQSDYLVKIKDVLEDTLADVDMSADDIHHIVMVGGSSRILAVQEIIYEYFNKKPIIAKDLDQLVAFGAGVYCGMLVSGASPYRVTQRVSHGTGINEGGRMKTVLPRNSKYGEWSDPCTVTKPTITVYQGNSFILKNCSPIGTIDLSSHVDVHGTVQLQLGTNANGVISYRILHTGKILIESEVNVD
jgi:molecular chaperone DnaK (HSP70)